MRVERPIGIARVEPTGCLSCVCAPTHLKTPLMRLVRQRTDPLADVRYGVEFMSEPYSNSPAPQDAALDVDGFASLAELALDLRSSWSHATDPVWRRLDPVL